MNKRDLKKIALCAVAILCLIFGFRFLGASILEKNMTGSWYYSLDDWYAVMNVSHDKVELKTYKEIYEIEYVDWNTFRVWHNGYIGIDGDYVDGYFEEFTVKFNNDKTEVHINPPIEGEGDYGIWHRGIPSREFLDKIAKKKAIEEAEALAEEKEEISKAYSDPKRHYGDIAIISVAGRFGYFKSNHEALYIEGRIYNRNNNSIDNIEITFYSPRYSVEKTICIESAAPNTYTEFSVFVPIPDGSNDSDYSVRARILGYDK